MQVNIVFLSKPSKVWVSLLVVHQFSKQASAVYYITQLGNVGPAQIGPKKRLFSHFFELFSNI
jgi:hypothetical protein